MDRRVALTPGTPLRDGVDGGASLRFVRSLREAANKRAAAAASTATVSADDAAADGAVPLPFSLRRHVNPVQLLLLAASVAPTPDHVLHWACIGYLLALAQAADDCGRADDLHASLRGVLSVVEPYVRRASSILRLLAPVAGADAAASASSSSTSADAVAVGGFLRFISLADGWLGGAGDAGVPNDVAVVLRALSAVDGEGAMSDATASEADGALPMSRISRAAVAVLPGLTSTTPPEPSSSAAASSAAASHVLPPPHFAPLSLIDLPDRFDVLYDRLSSAVCVNPACSADHIEEPALCLVCGTVVCAGTACCKSSTNVGECTRHAAGCSGGVGVFLMSTSSSVVLMRGQFSSYFASPYVDAHGEPDIGLARGRPLTLNKKRWVRGAGVGACVWEVHLLVSSVRPL